MIRITSRIDGFRRCGVAHAAAPTDWPDDRWTDDELAQLQGEPMLLVELIPAEDEWFRTQVDEPNSKRKQDGPNEDPQDAGAGAAAEVEAEPVPTAGAPAVGDARSTRKPKAKSR